MADEIIGSTAKIDGVQASMEALAQRAAEMEGTVPGAQDLTSDVEAAADNFSDMEALSAGETPTSTPSSGRTRQRSPDVQARQDLMTETARTRAAEEQKRQQIRTRTEEARSEATIRRVEAEARSAEARAAKVVDPPLDPSVVDAAIEFAGGFMGFQDEAHDAWMDEQLRLGIPITRQSMNALRPEMVSLFDERPREAPMAERRLAAWREFEPTYEGPRSRVDSAFNDFLGERSLLSPSEQLRSERSKYKESLADEHENPWQSMGMGFAIGFAATSLFSGVEKAIMPGISGESAVPWQAEEQAATSLLPMVGSIGATLAARKLGPGAEMAAQFVGQGAGQLLQDSIDQWTTGHIFAQTRAGEELGEGRGGAEAVKEFTDALRNAATPAAKELAEFMTKVGSTGPVSPSAAAGFGILQTDQGTAFERNQTAVLGYLNSSPFLRAERDQYGVDPAGQTLKGISSQEYLGIAATAALSGNYAAMQGALANAESVRGREIENPAYRRDQDIVDKYERESGSGILNPDFWKHVGNLKSDQEYADAKERLKKEPRNLADPNGAIFAQQEKQIQSWEGQSKDIDADLISGQAAGASATARLGRQMIYGGDGNTIRAALPEMSSAVDQQERAIQSRIANNRAAAAMFAATNPAMARQFQASVDADTAQLEGMGAIIPSQERAAFQMDEDAATAGYGYSRAQDQYSLTTGLLSGGSYASLNGTESTSLTNQYQRAGRLRELANGGDPYANQAQRDRYLTQATQIEGAAATDLYDYQRNVERQDLDASGLLIGRTGAGINRAGAYGGAREIGGAYDALDLQLAGRRDLLTNILAGTLTQDDRNRYQGQLDIVQAQLDLDPSKKAHAMWDSAWGVSEANISRGGAQEQAARISGGSDAANPLVFGTIAGLRGEITDLTRKSTNANFSDEERAQARAMAAGRQVDILAQEARLARYDQEPGDQGRQIAIEGALSRAGRSFLEQGDVTSLRSEALRMAREDVTTYDAQIRRVQSQLSPEEFRNLQPAIAQERNQLLGKVTDLSESMDADFFRNLPAMTIGGTSFMGRLLPSAAQAAASIEGRGYGGIAARNLGFFNHTTGLDIMGGDRALSAAGTSYAASHPGNLTADAIGKAVAFALQSVQMKSEVTIRNGSERQSATGKIQAVENRTQGMGQVLPGVPRN